MSQRHRDSVRTLLLIKRSVVNLTSVFNFRRVMGPTCVGKSTVLCISFFVIEITASGRFYLVNLPVYQFSSRRR